MKKYLVQISALIIVIGFLSAVYLRKNSPQGKSLTIINSNGESIEISVEIADNEKERTVGLSGRSSIPRDFGMLFVFDSSAIHLFWMKDTDIPLSIAFMNENGVIMDIQDMKPNSDELYCPNDPYRYALEVNRGFFDNNGIRAGCKIRIDDVL